MAEDSSMHILKSALLLEKRGRAFYSRVAEQTGSDAAKRFFQFMADEEKDHVRILNEQFKHYSETRKFKTREQSQPQSETVAGDVLTAEIKSQISAADFEAAAISAAMAMEKNAIQLYSKRAEEVSDPVEKDLYRWLAQWEKTHLDYLAKLDREITEQVWNDNSFWPF